MCRCCSERTSLVPSACLLACLPACLPACLHQTVRALLHGSLEDFVSRLEAPNSNARPVFTQVLHEVRANRPCALAIVLGIVLSKVSKVSKYQNIRYIVVVSKVFCPPFPWHLRFFLQDTERSIRHIIHRHRIDSFFLCNRCRIELGSRCFVGYWRRASEQTAKLMASNYTNICGMYSSGLIHSRVAMGSVSSHMVCSLASGLLKANSAPRVGLLPQ